MLQEVHTSTTDGQESLRRNGVAIIVNKSRSLKNDRMISVCFQGKPFNITVSQVYALTSNAEEAEVEWFYEDLQDLLERTSPKRCTFHYRGLEWKRRKSTDTWSNTQIWPWSTEWSRAEANRVLPREHTVIASTIFQQHKRRLYTGTSPDGQYQNQIAYALCSQRWRSSIQSTKTRLGTVTQIMNASLQNWDLTWRRYGKPLGHSGMYYFILCCII